MPDEIESRIAVLEMILLEVLSDLEPGRLKLAMQRIRDGGGGDAFERSVRIQAIDDLDAALRRHDVFG